MANDRKGLKVIIAVLAVLLVVNIVVIATLMNRAPGTSASGNDVTPPIAPPVAPSAKVGLTIIATDCPDCFDATQYQPELANIGVNFGETKQLDAALPEAKALIAQYAITKLPALVFSKELGTYTQIASSWDKVGTVGKDGSYILQGINPPYFDLADQKVHGLVTLTYLNDSSCADCYDVAVHQQILEGIGMKIKSTRLVDAQSVEGKALIATYNITGVPTVIIDSEAGSYLAFTKVWASVGTVVDGHYIFTQLDALGRPYKDLATGKLVTPPPQAAAPQ